MKLRNKLIGGLLLTTALVLPAHAENAALSSTYGGPGGALEQSAEHGYFNDTDPWGGQVQVAIGPNDKHGPGSSCNRYVEAATWPSSCLTNPQEICPSLSFSAIPGGSVCDTGQYDAENTEWELLNINANHNCVKGTDSAGLTKYTCPGIQADGFAVDDLNQETCIWIANAGQKYSCTFAEWPTPGGVSGTPFVTFTCSSNIQSAVYGSTQYCLD